MYVRIEETHKSIQMTAEKRSQVVDKDLGASHKRIFKLSGQIL